MTSATDRPGLSTNHLPRSGLLSFCLLLSFFALLAGLRASIYGISGSTESYKLATLSINYFDFGAMRRGLAGSIVHLAPVDLRTGAFLFYVIANLAVIAEAAWIMARRGPRNFAAVAPFILVAVAILSLWAKDVGRTDVMIGALLMLAAMAAARDRLLLASALLGIGVFAHECSVIFGLPLVASIVLSRPRPHRTPASRYLPAAVLLSACVLLYIALPHLPHASTRQLVDGVRAKAGNDWGTDLALMNIVTGERGIRDSLCQNAMNPNFVINGCSALVLITLCTIALAGRPTRQWAFCFAAALPPYAMLWIITLDNSRWITLSLLNVWLVCALADRKDGVDAAPRLIGLIFAVFLIPLQSPLLSRTEQPIITTSPLIGYIARSFRSTLRLHDRAELPVLQSLRSCDPGWASVLDDAGDVRP